MAGIAKVKVNTWRTTYHSIFPAEILRNLSYEENASKWRQRFEEPDICWFIYVAEDDSDKIVGFSMGNLKQWNFTLNVSGLSNYDGELMAVYVLQEHQRKHIGKKLVNLIVKNLLANNVKSMVVWVLKGNPNYKFYEILGGKYIGQKMLEIGNANYVELAYGWEDITQILEI